MTTDLPPDVRYAAACAAVTELHEHRKQFGGPSWERIVDAVTAVVAPVLQRALQAENEAPLRVGDPVPSETFEQVLRDSERIRRERNDWMREADALKARVDELEAVLRVRLRSLGQMGTIVRLIETPDFGILPMVLWDGPLGGPEPHGWEELDLAKDADQ